MDIEIRVPTPEDMDGIFDVRAQAFAVEESDRARWTALVNPAEMLTAFLGTEVVGNLNAMGLGQWFGGRGIPMGAVATVVVRPEHRGEGIAARLLEASLVRMRERGLFVSTLHPATTRVYRNAGWEIGGDLAAHRIPTRSLEHLPRGSSESLRRLTRDDWPLVQICYDAVAAGRNGWVDRNEWWWGIQADFTFVDQTFVYGVDGPDGLDGYVVFGQRNRSDGWGYRITVEELVAREPSAAMTLWRFLGSHGMQVEHIRVERGPIDELLLVLPEQDVEQVGNNRWMHRLVDAREAIAARGYPPDVAVELHLDLADHLAPWNEGRWVLRVEGGRGELLPGGTGELQLTINGLSTLATGWASATALAGAGVLHHAAAEDRAALDAIFAGPSPTMVDDF
ncbi:MAG: GNAT family N-acetyltransferase [Acidimicrobiia bacterium]